MVYSSRSNNPRSIEAMQSWMHNWEIDPDWFTFAHEKPPAFLTIDDRAIQFRGDWNAPELLIEVLAGFKPWNA